MVKEKLFCAYRKYLSGVLPLWVTMPLLGCFIINCAVYWSTQAITAGKFHYDFTLDFDFHVPLSPAWVSIYVLSYIFWGINYVIIAKESHIQCGRLVAADYIAKFICFIVFLLIPTTNVRPDLALVEGGGIWTSLLGLIYHLDEPTNLFPSIHCLTSWLCFIGLRGSKAPGWFKTASFMFAILVCVSTQFTKQHYIVDVIGGIGVAELSYWIGRCVVINGKTLAERIEDYTRRIDCGKRFMNEE